MAFGGAAPDRFFVASPGGILFVLVTQFGYVMFAEEVGWRAFALPHLLERFGSLGGTLILSVIHACWHLPMFLVPGSNQYGSSFAAYLFLHVAWSTMMSFLYYRSGRSALPCLLFHAGLNLPAFILAMPAGAEVYQRLLYGLLILLVVPLLPRPLFRR
jgi:membrane protease YdiL (CAAX protease family)